MIIILVIILFLFQFTCIALPVFPQEVRVRVLTNQTSVEISSPNQIYVINNKTGDCVTSGIQNITYYFKPDESGIKMITFEEDTPLLTVSLSPEIVIKPDTDGNKVSLNKKEYRGRIFIKRIQVSNLSLEEKNFFLDVINILDLEDYIRGTIKYEISPLWPEEAIKAHIVAARTYALFQIQNKKNGDFDLESTVLSQVYGGCSGEDTFTDALVLKTKGEYIDYNGSIIEGTYHACCGGYTEDSANVWGFSRPYLKEVRCPFCKGSSRYLWEKKFSSNEIQDAFKKNGSDLGNIIEIQIKKKSDTGRVLNLEIKGNNGKISIKGTDFRRIIGYDTLPSTLFTIYHNSKEEFIFSGRGWGHGVGMCQWGARGMALDGYNYKEILKFYYPGTEIKTLQ